MILVHSFFPEPQAQVSMITCRSTISLSLLQCLMLPTFTTTPDRSSRWPRSCIQGSLPRTSCTALCDCCRIRDCCSGTTHRTLMDWRDVSLQITNYTMYNVYNYEQQMYTGNQSYNILYTCILLYMHTVDVHVHCIPGVNILLFRFVYTCTYILSYAYSIGSA